VREVKAHAAINVRRLKRLSLENSSHKIF